MSGEVETCNGGDALESNCTINCFKSEALDYSTGIGVGRDTGKGRTGSSDVFRTYKRRRRATTVSDSKPHDDGRASATLACQLADQGGRKDNVLQNMYQSLSDDEGGIQGCIRDALAFHPVTGCMDNLKVFPVTKAVCVEVSSIILCTCLPFFQLSRNQYAQKKLNAEYDSGTD